MSLHRRCMLVLGVITTWFAAGASGSAQEALSQSRLPAAEFRAKDAGPAFASRRTPIVLAVERAKGAVVNIHSERHLLGGGDHFSLAPTQQRVNGMGTGIVIDPRGYIVTNHHVVDDVAVLRIRLADGASHNATVVARNAEMDLALIKIDPPQPLPTIPLGTAADLMVGETVVAIGNAYGYEHTVSVGIVSAIKRDVSLNKDMSYKSLIQTDASINPGNSGGPLLNINGELVGVNVAIRAGAQGIGFAIPVDHMIRAVADMLRSRRRSGVYDGLVCRDRVDISHEVPSRSVVVDRVDAASPAALAGLRAGDTLLRIGDTRIVCSYDVERALLDSRPGEIVPVVVRRGDKDQRLDLALGHPGGDRIVRGQTPTAGDTIWAKLGIQLAPAATETVTRVNRQLNGGLEIVAVNADGPAARAGIRKGDILIGLHSYETLSAENVLYVLTHPERANFSPLTFYILRGGQVHKGVLTGIN
ncbi:MAG: trypsin-like peptidase domain-containing protein [Gemmataceae bacterium]|nr:trypsin-like peptidase domain-containing protein [Gemmataceae bacterium]